MGATESADDMPDTRDAIVLRDYERKQLVEYLPQIIDLYKEKSLDDDDRNFIERFTEMHDAVTTEIDGTEHTYDFGADNWRDLSIALDELDDMRASWLRAKIGRRAELPIVHMGFTTTVPFMSTVTGEKPIRPD